MPIYAYRCESCGFGKDVLQKMSDAPLTKCPECGNETFRKQVTAAGFQLKGSGWYVTDFRGGNNAKAAPAANASGNGAAPANGEASFTASASSESASGNSNSTGSGASSSTAAAPAAPAATPASSSGSGST
ncbi:FmdB family zinc ribbon protein [Paraburkholderia sp. DHOC27]|uniref:FmdB family zinc ribbon protein n=1 Tax=Paraburkholderia sp. DHOC27 TaxID=2303330 RepID=UPI000E3D1B1E|nr:FmdB family zinc ribbon protein [Paraburkholderia sp. DHOC27]RFU47017.1 zinc ribbon domain-containing protein [Paraburkholderia sp. DHOC27]